MACCNALANEDDPNDPNDEDDEPAAPDVESEAAALLWLIVCARPASPGRAPSGGCSSRRLRLSLCDVLTSCQQASHTRCRLMLCELQR